MCENKASTLTPVHVSFPLENQPAMIFFRLDLINSPFSVLASNSHYDKLEID